MKTLLLVPVALIIGIMVGVYVSSNYTVTIIEDVRLSGKINYYEIPQLSLDNYIKVDIRVDSNNIYLIKDCRVVVMGTNPIQTNSIKNGLEGKMDFRPTTHDIVKNILDTYETDVLMVKITALEYDTYFAKLILQQGDKILNLDSRPSDAIAIAAKMDADIYVNNEILSNHSLKYC